MNKTKNNNRNANIPYAKDGKAKGYAGKEKIKLPKMMNRGSRAR